MATPNPGLKAICRSASASEALKRLLIPIALAPTLAASLCNAVLLRCISPADAEVPCHIWLIPDDPTLPIVELEGGERRVVPDGAYFIRAQRGALVQPGPAAVTIRDDEPDPLGIARWVRLRPGGRINVGKGLLSSSGALHFLSLETGAVETVFLSQRSFAVLPARRAIAVGLNGPDQVAGLTQAFDVVAGEARDLPGFRTPAEGHGDVAISFAFPHGTVPEKSDLKAFLSGDGGRIAPVEERLDRTGSHWAVFHDVPCGTYDVVVSSGRWQAKRTPVLVESRRLSFPDPIVLFARARLTLRLIRDGDLEKKPYSARLYRSLAGDEGCDADHIRANQLPAIDGDSAVVVGEREAVTKTASFEGLESGCYLALFECDGHVANALAGVEHRDVEVSARLAATRVSGSVYWSGTAGPARLQFVHLNDRTVQGEAEADSAGYYAVDLWQRGPYAVTIRPAAGGPKYERVIVLPVDNAAVEQDFIVAAETQKLRIVDEERGSAIAGASVCCIMDARGPEGGKVSSDETGRVELRLSKVMVGLDVSAEGYETSHVDLNGADAALEEREVRLRKLRDELSFTAVLPNGAPAAGARIFVLPPGVRATDVARTTQLPCDENGLCRLPTRYPESQALILVHPLGAITPLSTGEALSRGVATFLSIGGVASVEIRRAETSRNRLLCLLISLRGYEIPTAALEVANVVSGEIARGGPRLSGTGPSTGELRAALLPGGPLRIGIAAEVVSVPGDGTKVEPETVLTWTESWIPQGAPIVVQVN